MFEVWNYTYVDILVNFGLCLDRIRRDYIVRQTIALLFWRYYLERWESATYLLYELHYKQKPKFEFELDFELTSLQMILDLLSSKLSSDQDIF